MTGHVDQEEPLSDKMRALRSDLFWAYSGGYRHTNNIQWRSAGVGRDSCEIFGTDCPLCGQAWGWLGDLKRVQKYRRAMERLGCPACAKRGVERPREALSKAQAEAVRALWLCTGALGANWSELLTAPCRKRTNHANYCRENCCKGS